MQLLTYKRSCGLLKFSISSVSLNILSIQISIVSNSGTFNYKLSKYLVTMLAPTTTNKIGSPMLKKYVIISFEQCVLASFDAKSLFTNIPLSESIDMRIDSMFKETDEIHNFSKPQLHTLLSLAARDCGFLFNKKDGVAIGNPLGPTLAKAFLAYHEVNWLNECPVEFKLLIYHHYVDDTFLVFKSPDRVPLFLEYVNAKQADIEFTSEVESNGKL